MHNVSIRFSIDEILCQNPLILSHERFCLSLFFREMDEMSGQDPSCTEMLSKDQKVLFQRSEPSLNSLDHNHQKERLPSIVVEPTELSEVESGELRWPPENLDMEDDEEDLFLEQCIPPANIADWGEEEEEEGASVILNQQPGLTLIDLQADAFQDDTPTLPPSSTPAFN
uniref:LBH domain-containing protein n=1 Tax=Oryzias latipes TaxID=8090 RepID=A0A3P9KPR6_ORYLA